MKRRFTILTAAFALLAILAIPMGMMGQTRTEVTYDFSEIPGFDQWGSSYSQHVVEYDDATVTFTSANKNNQTITDIPVTKGQPVSLVLNETTNSITSATFVCRQWGTKAQTITLHYSTDGGTNYTSTNITSTNFTISSNSLPEGTNAVKITFSSTSNQVGIESATINVEASSSTAVATAITIDDTNLTNTDVYVDTEAGSLSATVTAGETTISGATVTWTSSDEEVATIDANGVVTLVAEGTTTITATYAGVEGQYLSSSATYTLEVTDSTPFTGGDVTFVAGTDLGSTTSNADGDEMTKLGVTVSSTSAAFATSEYRIYGGSTTTISTSQGTITQIVFTKTGSYNLSNLSTTTGSYSYDSSTGTWTGNANSIAFTASAQVRLSQIVVTVDLSSTPDPVITANNVNIAYDATSGEIAYTLDNPATNGSLSVSEDVDWISNAVLSTTENKVTFEATANEATTAREGIITITYTYGDNETVSKDVTVTQAAAPVIYTTIPDLFAAATGTETPVLVTFNNWVVSGVSSNGKNIFVTDNNGNGFVIYFSSDMSSTFAASDILSGTAVSCNLKKYNGFAELLNVDATDLTITSGGTVTVADVALADLTGVNTGALLHYDNLTCVLTTNSAGTTTYYNLTDGTTTIQVYNAIYAFGTLVEGKTYNITGVYQQYNNTKEILPRSAADIEEVVSTEPTITLDTYEINVDADSHNDIQIEMTASNMPEDVEYYIEFYDANGTEIEDEDDEPDWLNPVVDDNIVFCFISSNANTEARTAYFKVAAYVDSELFVSSDMVTVNQAAYVAPAEPGSWVLTNLADLTADDIFVIVGTDNDTEYTYAIPNNGGTNAPTAVAVTVVNRTLSGEPDAELQWNVSGNANDGYTFYPNGDANNWLYCGTTANSGSNNNIKVGTGNRKLFVLDENDYLVTNDNYVNRYLSIYNNNGVAQDWRGYINTTNGAVAISFYKKTSEPITENPTIDIIGYTEGSEGGYYLIASPVTVNPSLIGMTEGEYDLYYFDENQEDEWQNYKQEAFNLVPGKGYLYAKQATENELVFQFELSGTPYNQQPIVLSKHEGGDFSGWNLVGNPYYDMAYLSNNRAFYVLDDDGKEIIASEEEAIAPTQGFFVIATEDGETLTITTEEPAKNGSKLVLNVTSNRGNVIDRAIVRFDKGSQLPKFQLHENSTKVSIAKENNDYAVIRSEAQGEMPVSFKASENGNYTFSINTENVEMDYLHLIDNMTGADIDLIATPSYSFEAKVTDYTNRFRLVFNANNGINEQGNDNFAFFNGSELIINNEGEATLQVVDILGRVISCQNINGNENINLNVKSGAYMIRLINGNDVKTQKIVVE